MGPDAYKTYIILVFRIFLMIYSLFEFLQSISKVIVTSSAIDKMFKIFGPIFEQNL